MKTWKKKLLLIGIISLVLAGCGRKEPLSGSGFYFDTYVTITLYDHREQAILEGCSALLAKYEKIFSRTDAESELYRLNAGQLRQADGYAQLSEDLSAAIAYGLAYSRQSGGALSITLAPVITLWDFTGGTERIPQEQDIQEALQWADDTAVILEEDGRILLPEGMAIDLGAIAKGYIADRIRDYLTEQGVTCAIIDLGGNVVCIGSKTPKTGFRIGIQKPFSPRNETAAIAELTDYAAVTSGTYERYFRTEDGTLYHHIIDAHTGYPCQNGLISVTIFSRSAVQADTLSTTCFCLGLERGMELIDSLTDVYAIFITEDGEMHYSEGTKERFQLK